MKILKNRFILGVISLIIAVMIGFVLMPIFNEKINKKVDIIKLNTDVKKGTLINEKMLKVESVGGYNLDEKIIKNKDNIINKYAVVDMFKNDSLTNKKLSDIPLSDYPYLDEFLGEKRAVSITVQSLASGFSNKLEKGDIVSIYGFKEEDEIKKSFLYDELKFVEVLAITVEGEIDKEEDESNFLETDEEKRQMKTITLKCNEIQAKKLVEMEYSSSIHVVFVYRGKKADEFLAKQEDIIDEIVANKDKEDKLKETLDNDEFDENEVYDE